LESIGGRGDGALLYTLLAAFAALLHRYSDEREVVVGILLRADGAQDGRCVRESPGFPDLVHIDLAGDPGLRELAGRVRLKCRQVHGASARCGDAVAPVGRAEDELGRVLIHQFVFEYSGESIAGDNLVRDKHSPSVLRDGSRMGNELSLIIASNGRSGLDCTIGYNAELFESATIRRMLGHLHVLMSAAVANPDRPISTLPLLTESERCLLIEEWSGSDGSGSTLSHSSKFVHDLFDEQVSRTPDAVAILFKETSLTFRELGIRSNRLAHALRRRRVGPNVRVGISLERSPELVIALLAILKAGGAFVPLDPSFPADRLSALLAATRPKVLITDSRIRPKFGPVELDVLLVDAESASIAAESPGSPSVRVGEEYQAAVMFSAGSTGVPKAIPRAHRALGIGPWTRSHFQLDESDRHVFKTSLDSTLLLREVFWPILTGGRMIIAGPGEGRDVPALLRLLILHRITILSIVPSLLRLLLADGGLGACTALRHVSCFGEPLPADTEHEFRRSLKARLSSFYGTTEVSSLTMRDCCTAEPRPLGNLGHRLGRAQVYILDARLQPVPIGVPGELFGGGPYLASGYLDSRVETEERFIRHPFSPNTGERLHRTGDRVRWRSDGSLEFLGRIDEQVKIRGNRINPIEVETALAAHPAVLEAAVVARPDHAGDNQLVAFVVPGRDPLTAASLRSHLKASFPDHMIPSTFARLARMPRRPNGKLDRPALPARGFERLPSGAAYVGPRTQFEERLACAWREVLGVEAVGIHDDFFVLGGHSLAAVRLIARIQKDIGCPISVGDLLRAPTIETLAVSLGHTGSLVDAAAKCSLGPNLSRNAGTLTLIQRGNASLPIVGIPGAYDQGGSLLGHGISMGAIARRLGDQQTFLVATPGPAPIGTPALEVIPRLAQRIADEIHAGYPSVPIGLVGYSYGGLLAVETARRLLSIGREVALLALLDSYGPGFPRRCNRLQRLGRQTTALRELEIRQKIRSLIARLTSRREPQSVADPVSMAAKSLQLESRRAYLRNVLPYPGRITVLRAAQAPSSTQFSYDDSTQGWSAVAAGGVDVHIVPGNHLSMLDHDRAPALADVLRSCLIHRRR
jgi:amino acid adenylation domain-containing protein